MNEIHLKITDREGLLYEIEAPTDMNMNLMEVMRAYEIAQDGEIGICGGMAMCASCQCYNTYYSWNQWIRSGLSTFFLNNNL